MKTDTRRHKPTFTQGHLMDTWFKRWLLIGECLLALGSAYAQVDFRPSHSINASIAYDYGYLKDQNFSPLNYQEQGKTYSLTYQWKSARQLDQLSFRADYGTGILQTKASSVFTTDYIRGNLSISYLRKLFTSAGGTTQWSLGSRYHFYLNYMDWEEQSAFSFFANHSLDISTSFQHQVSALQQFSAQLHVPLWSLIVRPPYNGFDQELVYNNEQNPLGLITDGTGGSFNRLIAFQLNAAYQYQLSPRWGMELAYQARYQNLSDTHKLIHLQHQLSAGLQLKF